MAFICWHRFPLSPLSEFFKNHKWVLNFVKSFFCIYWDGHIVLLMWYITLIDLQILENPCVPGINPTWSQYMILLMGCWIWFVSIWWRISGLWEFLIIASISVLVIVYSYFQFLPGSALEVCIFLSICPFLLGCPFYWHIIVCSSFLWSFILLWCQL